MNILIIRYSSLGDLVTLEPFFRAVRYFYPKSYITFLTSPIGKGLYKDTVYFDRFVIEENKYIDTINSIKQLSDYYDLVFDLQCNSISHFSRLFIRKGVAINSSRTLFQKIFHISSKLKSIYQMLQISGIEKRKLDTYRKDNKTTQVILPYKADKEIIQLLNKFKNYKIIGIGIGASQRWDSKKWGIENYKNLIKKLSEKYIIVLVGSSLEEKDAKELEKQFSNIINFVAKTNLTQLKTLLANFDLYIGNDSGPSHIAAALGTNTVTIFGPTDIKHCTKFGNYRGNHKCIKPDHSIHCHPCYKPICPTNAECMKNISVQKVYETIERMIDENSSLCDFQ